VFNGWAANVHPDDLDYCLTAYSSAFDARRGFQMECRLRRADGEYRWILGNGVPLHTAGEFTGFIGSCIDVTERKLVEDRLRTSEARLMDAQRLAKIGSWERSIDGADVAYWSHEMFRIFGRPIGALPSFSDFISYVHPDDREKMRTTMQQARTGTAPVIVEFRIFRPDGEVRCLRSVVELIRNDQGVPVRVAGATQDVTDQVKARELLRESEERLKSAQRLAHVGNWDWDIKENRLFWSEEIYRIFGRPRHYTPHYEDFLQAIQPQDRERVSRRIRDALGGQIPQFLEFQISRPDGDARTVACMSEVLRDDGGLPVRMIGACLDVTDQKCAEAALRRSLDEIAHLNRVAAMGELTASLAHELNQPLAAILSNAQAANRFLGSKPPDVAQASACLTDIIADDKRAGEVIKRLRGLLRKEEFQASLVDLNEIVSDAIRLVGNDALLRKSSLKFEPFPHLPLVPGDRIQIYQVVLNLVMNALEAAAERPPGDRWVLVRTLESEGGRIELTVEDSGGGIAENDLARVFEPFFSTKPEGLGMGLSISRSIVRAHGGRIWADNNARGSAIFHFVLPLTQEAGTATA
jgi:PAS domain S-box-containing protein